MAKRTKKFKTEVQQLLDLVIHSLYSKKEIFLRELVSNASDAIDRLRFEALTDKKLLKGDPDGRIKIHADKDAGTITISDNGIGMSAEEVEQNIGTIANSGTRNFLENLKAGKGDNPEFIGQFGVGFYASFMVADKVTVLTRRAGSDTAVRWVSAGAGNYTIEEGEKESRGTDITLHLREGMEKYLEEWEIRQTIKAYSDYIAYPVVMDVVRTQKAEEGEDEIETVEEETLNSMKAIWKKAKADVSDDEYNEFYKHVSHDYAEPLKVIHYAAEGTTEFRALLYLPSQAPFDMFWPEQKHGIHLYVRNVFITDDCKDLLPPYLRFVRGVVDSSDLPLNVSREMLQDDAVIRRIRKSLVGKVLGALADMRDKERDSYASFYAQFGKVLKEGVHSDFENYDKLKDLLLFQSTKTEAATPVSLQEYVGRMPQGQKEIYYITADSVETAARSPHLETLRGKDFEVLFFVDPIDEWVATRLTEYDGKKLKAVDRGDLDLGDDEEDKASREEKREERSKELASLMEFIQKKLDEEVKEVRISDRLTDSPCCLVVDEQGMNPNMERIMRAMNQDVPKSKRILEVNPDHALLKKVRAMFDKSKRTKALADYIDLLYDQALIAEGGTPRDAQRFTALVSQLMAKS